MNGKMVQYFNGIFDKETTNNIYNFLKDNVPWTNGIYSKSARKISRKAYSHNPSSNSIVDIYLNEIVSIALDKIGNCAYYGVYVNYYQNGYDFCPNHSHPNTRQMVISFGAVRTLKVGNNNYPMESGDGILFGSSIHGIKEEPSITEGRISVAIFLVK